MERRCSAFTGPAPRDGLSSTTKKERDMPPCQFEPTLAEALADPLVQAVMAADGVDPDKLAGCLGEVAEWIRERDEEE